MQGREHEWLFASPEGQRQVAQGCSARRVIVVSLNRGHTFGSLKAVQAELSPLVVDLAPIGSRQLEAAIPFMTTQEGIGSRSVHHYVALLFIVAVHALLVCSQACCSALQ